MLVGMLLLVVSLSACSEERSSPKNPDATVSGLAENAPVVQQQALADGVLSQAEYEEAVNAARGCIADAGYEVSEPFWEYGELLYTADADYSHEIDPTAADERFLSITDGCRGQYLSAVGEAWVLQTAATIPK